MTYEDTYKNITIRRDTSTHDLYVYGKLTANIEQISPHNEGVFVSALDDDVYTLTISTDTKSDPPHFVELTRTTDVNLVEVLHQESGMKPYTTTMISHYLGSGYSYSFTNDANTVLLFFNDHLTMHGTALTKQRSRSFETIPHPTEILRELPPNHHFFPYI